MSKTAFLMFASIIGLGVFGTILLAIIKSSPVGILISGGLIFGILCVILMFFLSDKDWKLNDDFKMTFIRIKKYTLPKDVDMDDIYIDSKDGEYIDETEIENIKEKK